MLRGEFQTFDFPSQRVSASERNKPEWYANSIDWIIAQGQGIRQQAELEVKYRVLQGDIPQEYYKKILNPYNATNEKYKRFPAVMRNYDIMKGIIRRYVSEYIKNPHDFVVGANNPEVILSRNKKLQEELASLVEKQIAARIQQSYAEFINQGGNPQEFNPQETIDIESFIKEFNQNFIDDISAQGAELLNVIKDLTDDTAFYGNAYFNFVTFGEVYTYTDIIGDKLIKKVISPRDAFPIPNDSIFVEDYDMFACRRKLTYQQIIDEFSDYFTEKDIQFLNTYYARHSVTTPAELMFKDFEGYYPDVCNKFTQEERQIFKTNPSMSRDINADLYDVWHVVWRGEVKRNIVTYVNQAGLITTRIEEENYKLNPEIGDISIESIYEPQVYEGVRIGTRNTCIYPYKARAIAYNRNGKLPYNGITELLPGFGKFSIIDIVTPFQIFYNIVAYQREMAIAKNKLSILLIAKSLLGTKPEETIYKMLADGTLYIDDTNDQGMLRAQQVRMIQADLSSYIQQLTQLMMDTEQAAKNQCDMTPQRYGEIASYAGKGTTEEAIARGSMGSVIVEFMMDMIRERDYARDMDYSKLAWIDGLDTSYRDDANNLRYVSADIDKHIYADYVIKAKNSVKESEKIDALRQFAFSAAQNGDAKMAVAAIEGDNVAEIVKLINRFQDEKNQHEQQLKQMDQQLAQMNQEFELAKIQAKGEEDRKTEELRGYINQQIELIRADANMISYPNDTTTEAMKQQGAERLEESRNRVEREKNQIAKQAQIMDLYNKERDREVKLKDIETKLKVAKENKNRYDKPKSATKK